MGVYGRGDSTPAGDFEPHSRDESACQEQRVDKANLSVETLLGRSARGPQEAQSKLKRGIYTLIY